MDTSLDEVKVQNTIVTSAVAMNLFWLGFIVYIASFVISTSDEVNYVICNIFQITGLLLMVPSAVLLMSLKIENTYLKAVFFVYILWLLSVVIRGIQFDYESIKQLLFDPSSGLFLYLVPLVILIPVSSSLIRRLFTTIAALSIIYLLYDLIFIRQLLYPYENMRSQAMFEYFTQHLSLPGGFFLLTYIYHSKKNNLMILFTLAVTFVLAVIRARRGLMLMSFSMLFFAFFIYQYVNKTRVVNIIVSLFFVIMLTYGVVRIYSENRKDTFSLITERIGQQTRLEVEQYFYRDLKTKDWIIGKGMNGEYFCPGVNEGEGRITIYRKVIETGFLQIILKGGVISLGLLALIAFPAIFKGLFNSRNILSKAAGIWVLLLFFFLYPATPTMFSLHYIIVWISIGICYSDRLRNLTDLEILNTLEPVGK